MMVVQGRDYEHTLEFDRFGAASGWRYQAGDAVSIGRHVLSGAAFDAAEFSLSAVMIMADRGPLPFVPVPVFPARAFFHSYLFVRSDSALHELGDLAGRRIGLRDFSSTGAIWFRGLLTEIGLNWRDITWVTGGSGRFTPPEGAKVTPVQTDLEQMLMDGEIDLYFSARVKDRSGRLRPLLGDSRAQEADYGFYPIMHTVVVSKAALDARPGAAREVFAAYDAAKRQALTRKLGASFMPWADANWAAAIGSFGPDPLPYGLGPENRHALALLGGALAEQELTRAVCDVDALFSGVD